MSDLSQQMQQPAVLADFEAVDMDSLINEIPQHDIVDASLTEVEVEGADDPKEAAQGLMEQLGDLMSESPMKTAKELADTFMDADDKDKAASSADLDDKDKKRNKVVIKQAVRQYNKLQTGGFAWLYDWFGSPLKARKRDKELRSKMGQMSPAEQQEFTELGRLFEQQEAQRTDFMNAVRMDDEDMEVIIECATEVFEVEEIKMNPWTVLIFVVVIQLLGNAVLLWTHTSRAKRMV